MIDYEFKQDNEAGDFTLKSGRVWVTIGKLSVRLAVRFDGTAEIEVYPLGREQGEPIIQYRETGAEGGE